MLAVPSDPTPDPDGCEIRGVNGEFLWGLRSPVGPTADPTRPVSGYCAGTGAGMEPCLHPCGDLLVCCCEYNDEPAPIADPS